MAFGDSPHDDALRREWHNFCDQLKTAGDQVFKDYTPPSSLQRADGFRFLTQNLGQAFDLALETKDTRYPMLHPFCTPSRKLGCDNADFVYHQAWIDGNSVYKITGNKGTARFFNIAVQGPRPEMLPGTNIRSLHEPFGDSPEANLFGHQLQTEWDGSFELYIGGPQRESNWLPTTPGSRKLFLRQGFDKWEEESAEIRIERIDMDTPRPLPAAETLLESIRWAGNFLTSMMNDWPEYPLTVGVGADPDRINSFPGQERVANAAEDKRRGRAAMNMRWRLAADETLIVEFDHHDSFWMFTNMGSFLNSMDFLYRPVSYTPSRVVSDSDNRIRLIMSHTDPGYHNWLDTQGFEEGNLAYRNILGTTTPELRTQLIKTADLEKTLPKDSRRITSEERVRQMHQRFNAIRRRYR